MKKLKIIYIIYFLFPIINLITGLMTRYNLFSLTIGMAIRIALLLFMAMYVLFYSKSKYKKPTIIYYVLLGLFCITYIVTKPEFFTIRILFNEATYLFKFMYLPIIFFGMLNLIDEGEYEKDKWNKIFFINLILYLVFIIVPIITKTSFNAYVREAKGLVGWFYAANEVGPCLLLLLPSVFVLLKKQQNLFLPVAIIVILATLAISTKVSNLGLGIVLFVALILFFVFNRKKDNSHRSIIVICILYLILISNLGTSFFQKIENYNANISKTSEQGKKPINTDTNKNESENIQDKNDNENIQDKNESQISKDEPINKQTEKIDFISRILSNRNKKAEEVHNKYLSSSFLDKLFGIGFYNIERNEIFVIEMDVLDIFYHYGIIGSILFLAPYIFIAYLLIKNTIYKKIKLTLELCLIILLILLILGIGFLAGHIMGAPTVSSYLVIYLIRLYTLINKKEKMKE